MKRRGKDRGEDGRQKSQISPENKDVWDAAMRDVAPLNRKGGHRTPENYIGKVKNLTKNSDFRDESDAYFGNMLSPATDVDRNTNERLRRGLMPVEARLDLHSMTQDRAYAALQKFICQNYDKGRRCVLVITGTGARHRRSDTDKPWYETPSGVLRERVPEWLRESRLAGMVLRFYPAQKRHGGEGALYILIRRKRER